MDYAPPEEPKPPPPEVTGYNVETFVGRGACGDVWAARESLTGVRRALKLLPKNGRTSTSHLARELAGIRQFQQKSHNHPALIQIYHVDQTDDFYFYSMELADNVNLKPTSASSTTVDQPESRHGAPYHPFTLHALIRAEAPVEPRRALSIVAQILSGLNHLHGNGLVHRDVKPSNVLIVDGRFKLGDIGLVTDFDRDVTQVGTLGYMPPDGRMDQCADLYAAGIILYELITGYERARFPELPVLKPNTRRESRDLRAAIHIANRAAHPDRRRRYTSAADMLRDVTRRPRLLRPRKIAAAAAVMVAGAAVTLGITLGTAPPPRLAVVARAPGDSHVIELLYEDGSKRLVRFGSPLCEPVAVDFLGNGEPLVAVGAREAGDIPGRLMILDPRNPNADPDSALFSRDMYESPPWNHQAFPAPCGVEQLLAADLDGKPGEELVILAEHHSCPIQISTLAQRGGGFRFLSRFWHYGHCCFFRTADLNADGLPELIVGGLANERGPEPAFGAADESLHACVMVLDPRRSTSGAWSMNNWMNNPDSAPLAYGYCTHETQPPPQPGWYLASLWAKPNSDPPIWLALHPGILLELDRNLRAARPPRHSRGDKTWSGPLPSSDELWVHVWPPDLPADPDARSDSAQAQP